MPRLGHHDAMRQLILIRHAKSSWADPALDDAARPLNDRGRVSAPVIGAWLAGRGFHPDAALLSPALRVQQTWERLAPQLRSPPLPETRERLYMADPATMLDLLREMPATATTVLMIGHQPGISSFARLLAAEPVPAGCARAFTKFPTAAAAVIRFDATSWDDTGFGTGRFDAFAVPKELI